jgi:hypothetical protein
MSVMRPDHAEGLSSCPSASIEYAISRASTRLLHCRRQGSDGTTAPIGDRRPRAEASPQPVADTEGAGRSWLGKCWGRPAQVPLGEGSIRKRPPRRCCGRRQLRRHGCACRQQRVEVGSGGQETRFLAPTLVGRWAGGW